MIWGLIFAGIFWAWNTYKDKREARTFTISFHNVDGLAKGAPIYSKGVQVGKVIGIFPLGNSNNVGVKGLIVDKNFPAPGPGVSAKIITDIERGGAKILEITNTIPRENATNSIGQSFTKAAGKGKNPYIIKHTVRLMRDFLQLSKDWANDTYKAFSSKESREYQEDVANSIENTITSMEHGTLKSDIQNKISNLNREIKSFEKDPKKEQKTQKLVEHKVKSLKNTLQSYKTLSDVYKE